MCACVCGAVGGKGYGRAHPRRSRARPRASPQGARPAPAGESCAGHRRAARRRVRRGGRGMNRSRALSATFLKSRRAGATMSPEYARLVEGGRFRKRRRESERRWTEQKDGCTFNVGPPAFEDKKAREERLRRPEEQEGCIVWRPVLQEGNERDARRMARAVGMHGRSGVGRGRQAGS